MLHTEGCDLSDAEHSGRLISCYSMVNFCEQFLTMAIKQNRRTSLVIAPVHPAEVVSYYHGRGLLANLCFIHY